jgi:serine/threonine-protein kinase HipA
MIFNLVVRNQDDHTKNVAFLMDQTGTWRLSPAYDITYSYNPAGAWTAQHQMTVNGKRDHFTADDLSSTAETAGLKRGRWKTLLQEVLDATSRWPDFAKQAGVPEEEAHAIAGVMRRNW